MSSPNLGMPTVYDLEKKGEKLLALRPKPLSSEASLLKGVFFDKNLYVKNIRLGLMQTMLMCKPNPEDRYELNLWSCIDDEERFWFAMCVLKYNHRFNPNNPVVFEKVYIDVVSENAEKFGQQKEVAKLLLNLSERRDVENERFGLDPNFIPKAPEDYKIDKS